MKRSEMIVSLREFLLSNQEGTTVEEMASAILSHLESEGMLPPPASTSWEDSYEDVLAFVQCEFYITDDDNYGWEPENKKN